MQLKKLYKTVTDSVNSFQSYKKPVITDSTLKKLIRIKS